MGDACEVLLAAGMGVEMGPLFTMGVEMDPWVLARTLAAVRMEEAVRGLRLIFSCPSLVRRLGLASTLGIL